MSSRGYKVHLSDSEIDQLFDQADDYAHSRDYQEEQEVMEEE